MFDMANGSFEQHVAAIVEAHVKGLHHADLTFAFMAQANGWTANYANRVWGASRPAPVPGRPQNVGEDYDDDIPF